MAESMSLLPEDMLIEILSRLPVKTLIRLTLVCKQWLSLIRSPQFATKQLLTTESNLLRDNFQFFFTPGWDFKTPPRVFASLFSYESFELSARFEFSPCSYIDFSDPCHGIFCVILTIYRRETAFLLWNPAIREIEPLPFPLPPPVPDQQEDHLKFSVHSFGFGYDPEINDYKVFVIFRPNLDSCGLDWPVEVYNLREGYWKFLPPNSFYESMRPSFVGPLLMTLNGNMCNWFKSCVELSLISFDFSNQIFLQTSVPECCKQTVLYPKLLQSNKLDSKPRIMCCRYYSDCPDNMHDIEIWQLVEYGSSGCWIKQIVIEFPAYYDSAFRYYSQSPLGYWQDEKILILPTSTIGHNGKVIKRSLLTYNSTTKELKSTGLEHTLELSLIGRAYIESLVSVKELCRRRHNQQEHRPLDYSCLATAFSVREVNAPASSINSFPSYYFEWFYDN
ncbi:hypothetical protein Dimus_015165 [Dionaea muscipula]